MHEIAAVSSPIFSQSCFFCSQTWILFVVNFHTGMHSNFMLNRVWLKSLDLAGKKAESNILNNVNEFVYVIFPETVCDNEAEKSGKIL